MRRWNVPQNENLAKIPDIFTFQKFKTALSQETQVIFEAKNYVSLKSEDFQQINSYLSGDYGKFCVVVTRSTNEGLSTSEKAWVKDMWFSHNKLVFIIPAIVLCRCMSKLRNMTRKGDYTEDQLK